jgi:hypothetical protein
VRSGRRIDPRPALRAPELEVGRRVRFVGLLVALMVAASRWLWAGVDGIREAEGATSREMEEETESVVALC